MIYSSLDSSCQDESNDSKIIPIGAIFAEIAIFAKFQVGSGRVNCLTRPEFSGRVGSGTRISGQKCEALDNVKKYSDHKVLVAHFQVHHDGNRKIENFIKNQENMLNEYPNTINHLNS